MTRSWINPSPRYVADRKRQLTGWFFSSKFGKWSHCSWEGSNVCHCKPCLHYGTKKQDTCPKEISGENNGLAFLFRCFYLELFTGCLPFPLHFEHSLVCFESAIRNSRSCGLMFNYQFNFVQFRGNTSTIQSKISESIWNVTTEHHLLLSPLVYRASVPFQFNLNYTTKRLKMCSPSRPQASVPPTTGGLDRDITSKVDRCLHWLCRLKTCKSKRRNTNTRYLWRRPWRSSLYRGRPMRCSSPEMPLIKTKPAAPQTQYWRNLRYTCASAIKHGGEIWWIVVFQDLCSWFVWENGTHTEKI